MLEVKGRIIGSVCSKARGSDYFFVFLSSYMSQWPKMMLTLLKFSHTQIMGSKTDDNNQRNLSIMISIFNVNICLSTLKFT